MLKLGRVTKVKVPFLVLVFVFHFDLFKFSAAILEKGLLANQIARLAAICHFHMSHNPFRVGGQPVEEMYGIMTKISSVSSQNQLLKLKNAPEFTKIMIGEICTSL